GARFPPTRSQGPLARPGRRSVRCFRSRRRPPDTFSSRSFPPFLNYPWPWAAAAAPIPSIVSAGGSGDRMGDTVRRGGNPTAGKLAGNPRTSSGHFTQGFLPLLGEGLAAAQGK